MSNSEAVNIRILDREYTVGVKPEEEASLMAAVRLLDSRMRESRNSNRMASLEQVAVLVALNLAHELEQLRQVNDEQSQEMGRTLKELNQRIDRILSTQR